VHGLLHLHGFDDRKRADARKMEKIQKRILTATNERRRSISIAPTRLN
jgi:ssRNA-specific RNase YbeY (16S rRNA maturation enzyme)